MSTHPMSQRFVAAVPARALAGDSLVDGIWRQTSASALTREHIQINPRKLANWIGFDIDYTGAMFADQDGILPPANCTTINPKNGHAHKLYCLKTPVATSDAARIPPLQYLADVERGLRLRMDADPSFVGLITKNPLHDRWETIWGRETPYSLGELDSWLHTANKKHYPAPKQENGFGRNVVLFDELRKYSYKEVRRFKTADAGARAFHLRLNSVATRLNQQFDHPLQPSEIIGIAKSVAKWVWPRFSNERFSQIQSWRGAKGNSVRWGDARQKRSESLKKAVAAGLPEIPEPSCLS